MGENISNVNEQTEYHQLQAAGGKLYEYLIWKL